MAFTGMAATVMAAAIEMVVTGMKAIAAEIIPQMVLAINRGT